MDLRVGVDLGGHTISLGLVDFGKNLKKPEILKKIQIETPRSRSTEDTISAIAERILSLTDARPDKNLSFVGVGVPAMLDKERVLIKKAPNFPSSWENFAFCEALKIALLKFNLDLPIAMENDANVYALGEGAGGAAFGCSDYALLTLGTGIGGGFVLNGKLLRGSHGIAGEPGHTWIGGALRCGCGGVGHLETIASADGVERHAKNAKNLNLPGDFKTLWQASREKNNPLHDAAKNCIEPFLDALSGVIASIMHLMDVEVVVLGGGISKAQNLIEELKLRTIPKLAIPYRELLNLKISAAGEDAPLIGAAGLKQ